MRQSINRKLNRKFGSRFGGHTDRSLSRRQRILAQYATRTEEEINVEIKYLRDDVRQAIGTISSLEDVLRARREVADEESLGLKEGEVRNA